MRPVGIAAAPRIPGIAHRTGDLQRLLDLLVIALHLLGRDRPIDGVAELRARLEPFRAEAQRDHGEMDGAAPDPAAAVVAAEADRVAAAADPVLAPIELMLRPLVRGEI